MLRKLPIFIALCVMLASCDYQEGDDTPESTSIPEIQQTAMGFTGNESIIPYYYYFSRVSCTKDPEIFTTLTGDSFNMYVGVRMEVFGSLYAIGFQVKVGIDYDGYWPPEEYGYATYLKQDPQDQKMAVYKLNHALQKGREISKISITYMAAQFKSSPGTLAESYKQLPLISNIPVLVKSWTCTMWKFQPYPGKYYAYTFVRPDVTVTTAPELHFRNNFDVLKMNYQWQNVYSVQCPKVNIYTISKLNGYRVIDNNFLQYY